MRLSGSTLRAYTQSAGISSKGLQPELAMRTWQHILLSRAPPDASDVCTQMSTTTSEQPLLPKRGSETHMPRAIPIFLRRPREQNVFVKLLRPMKNGTQQRGFYHLGFTPTIRACEALCSARSFCDAYTWFLADAPEAWARSCIGQDLELIAWAPSRSQVATSGLKLFRSGSRLMTPRGQVITPQSDTPWREPCARRMEVFPGKLDLTLLNCTSAPVSKLPSPHDCHQACWKASTCERSVWIDPKGSSLLRHACFHLATQPKDTRHAVMVSSRRASSARKTARAQPTWLSPYEALSHRLLNSAQLTELANAAARVARNSSFAIIALQREQLPLARQFLCELKRSTDAKIARILWICSDAASCSFLDQNGLDRLASLPSPRDRSEGFILATRLRLSLCAVLLGYDVLLADAGAMWLQNPWPWLTGQFDIIASPEQRLGEGYGFPLGADFMLVRSTNASVNLLLEVLERVETLRVRSVRESATLLNDALNDMLFLGMAANGSLSYGHLGAQLRRGDWSELRVKVLDMEAFPAAHVAMNWWQVARRTRRASRIVVLRTNSEKRAHARLHQLKEVGASYSTAQTHRGDPGSTATCFVSGEISKGQLVAATQHLPIISVVMLSHGHAANIQKLCHSLLPCRQNELSRTVQVAGGGGAYAIQAVIVEDGSKDDSRAVWRKQLANLGDSGVSWMSRNGEAEAAVAFPAASRTDVAADLLLFAPNQHEIRSYHQGFALSWGDVLVTLQDDELYHEGDPTRSRRWLANALRLFELHPDLSMLSCNAGFLRTEGFACDMFDPHYKENCCYINKTGCWGEEIAPIPMHDPRLPGTPFMFVAGVNFGPFITRRDAYFALGAFDPSWSLVGDPGIGYDIEFSLRAQQRGHLVGVMQCEGIQRRVGGGSSLASLAKRRLRYVMERRNNMRLDQLYFNDKDLMQGFVARAMRENRRRLKGDPPL